MAQQDAAFAVHFHLKDAWKNKNKVVSPFEMFRADHDADPETKMFFVFHVWMLSRANNHL